MQTRWTIFVLCLTTIVSLSADGVPPSGTGTQADPFLIETLDNLLWMSTTGNGWLTGSHYLQTADIDATETAEWNDGAGYNPNCGAGEETFFHGVYNGNGHTISNLYINRPTVDQVGFFGAVSGAYITGLTLSGVTIYGGNQCGGIAGYAEEGTNIVDCQVEGSIEGLEYVGGIVGFGWIDFTVQSCQVDAQVQGTYRTGGIMGYGYDDSYYGHPDEEVVAEILDCVSSGAVTGTRFVGGIIGHAFRVNIQDSHSSCGVSGTSVVGGLAGFLSGSFNLYHSWFTGQIQAYSEYGGLYGNGDWDHVVNCRYDYDTSLINNQPKVTFGALTTTLFQDWLVSHTLDPQDYLNQEDGTYLIETTEQFRTLIEFGNNEESSFELRTDIDLHPFPNFFIPMMTADLTGGGHVIDGLNLDYPSMPYIGLFGKLYGGSVEGLRLVNVQVTGYRFTGGLTGLAQYSSIRDCCVQGHIVGMDSSTGGLVGLLMGDVERCTTTGTVTGNVRVGGLAGRLSYVSVDNCYSSMAISADSKGGGLAGDAMGPCTITDSYAWGEVQDDSGSSGAIIGDAVDWYDQAVGVWNRVCLYNLFWNTETSGQTTALGSSSSGEFSIPLGLSTMEMRN